jgi:hypothetical protein
MRVFLNPLDCYRIARFLNLDSTSDLFTRDYIAFPEDSKGPERPKILFKTFPITFCPFLVNRLEEDGHFLGLCSLHPDSKPLVCRLAPVGREWDTESGREQYVFIPPMPGCPGTENPRRVPLSNCLKPLKDDLEWEIRFFRLLLQIKKKGREKEIGDLYKLETGRDFHEIWTETEKRFQLS